MYSKPDLNKNSHLIEKLKDSEYYTSSDIANIFGSGEAQQVVAACTKNGGKVYQPDLGVLYSLEHFKGNPDRVVKYYFSGATLKRYFEFKLTKDLEKFADYITPAGNEEPIQPDGWYCSYILKKAFGTNASVLGKYHYLSRDIIYGSYILYKGSDLLEAYKKYLEAKEMKEYLSEVKPKRNYTKVPRTRKDLKEHAIEKYNDRLKHVFDNLEKRK